MSIFSSSGWGSYLSTAVSSLLELWTKSNHGPVSIADADIATQEQKLEGQEKKLKGENQNEFPATRNGEIKTEIRPTRKSSSLGEFHTYKNTVLEQTANDANAIIAQVLAEARNSDPVRRELILNTLYGIRSSLAFPMAELHKHLEGIPCDEDFALLLQYNPLFWAPGKERFRRHPTSPEKSKLEIKRIPSNELKNDFLLRKFCVCANPKEGEQSNLSDSFDKTFGPRGSLLDRVPLSQQFLAVMDKSVLHYTLYSELMLGIYDIPVPTAIEKIIEGYEKRMPEDKIKDCIDFLSKKTLGDVLNESEKSKLRSKILGRFGKGEGSEKYFQELQKLSYVEAFKNLLDRILSEADAEIAAIINERRRNGDCNLDPEIFDAKSVKTLKLILEIMRHYKLSEFIVWSIITFYYIQKDNSKVVGATLDGPQTHENSIKYFDVHIEVFKYLRRVFPKVKVTIHTLELERKNFEDSIRQLKSELGHVLPVAERIGHVTMINSTENLMDNLSQMQEEQKVVEICPTTANVTTGMPMENMPLKVLLNSGIPVTLNTDDPGIVYTIKPTNPPTKKFTNMNSELIDVVNIFGLSHEDVKTMMRNAIHFSFLNKESIYDVKLEKSTDGKIQRGNQIKIVYKLKKEFLWREWIEYYILIGPSPKEVIESLKINLASEQDKFNPLLGKQFKNFEKRHWIEFFNMIGIETREGDVKSLKTSNLTDKEIKECYLEMALDAYDRGIVNRIRQFTQLGYVANSEILMRPRTSTNP